MRGGGAGNEGNDLLDDADFAFIRPANSVTDIFRRSLLVDTDTDGGPVFAVAFPGITRSAGAGFAFLVILQLSCKISGSG